jgi:outer membrane protein OmpA-like peptidoglycan-associated protein
MVMVLALPIVAHAQPAPATAAEGEAEIELGSDCEHEPTCLAAQFADAMSSQPAGPQALRLESAITFDPGRVRVYSRGREKLEALARAWQAHARWATITVEGYADPSGDLALGERRADRVRGYLIRYGVPPEYVAAVGLDDVVNVVDGARAPVMRASGRRVDLTIAACEPASTRCRVNGFPSASVSTAR